MGSNPSSLEDQLEEYDGKPEEYDGLVLKIVRKTDHLK